MVKVKLCGNQTEADVEHTAAADAQGFIVMADSRREIELEAAAELIAHVPVFNLSVLVTTATDPLMLSDMVESLGPDVLQIHQTLSPIQVSRIRRALGGQMRLVAAIGVRADDPEVVDRAQRLAEAGVDALVLDSQVGDQLGGTGTPHPWEQSARIREAVAPFPVILAGGLCPENIAEAIEIVRPYGVDVASGVESQGRKDPQKVASLLRQVRLHER